MDFENLLEEIFTAEVMPDDARTRIAEAFSFHNELSAEKIAGLETANGDAMTNIAAIETERDELRAQLAAIQAELVAVKAGEFDKLMNGGTAASPDDDIAADPDPDPDDYDPDITVDDLISKHTESE